MMNTLHLTTTRRLPVAFVVPDWSALDEELVELLVHGALLRDAARTASMTTLDHGAFELARVQHTLSIAASRWETRNRTGLVPEGRARAIALLHAYEAAIDAATRIADIASAALDREVCDAEIEEAREKLVRTLVEIGHLV